jgi:transcription elongation GreA/GreB family factor
VDADRIVLDISLAENGSATWRVADRVERLETRLTELEEERESIQQARENGSLSEGAFNARMASLAARIDGVERQLRERPRAVTVPVRD